MTPILPRNVEFNAFFLCCGIGGGAIGFQRGHARHGQLSGRFRTIGAVDVDEAAVKTFRRLTGSPATVLDLFSRAQYRAFHGHEPPSHWREATAQDLRDAAGGEYPVVIFTSPPCPGFSGLVTDEKAAGDGYQALDALTVRSVQLALEAWANNPPALFILENVPLIQTRGRALLDDIRHILEMAGYAVAETVHNCGELGGLAQNRKRFLLVARHRAKIPNYLYEPERKPVRAIGDVLSTLPLPDDGPHAAGLHRLPRLHMKTWIRLALIKAGGDWRDLEQLQIADGIVQGIRLVPDMPWHRGTLGVTSWDQPIGTIIGSGRPTNGAFGVADPRTGFTSDRQQYGVVPWTSPAHTVTGQNAPGGGSNTVADPRFKKMGKHSKFHVEGWDSPAHTVTGTDRVGSGMLSVADPRLHRKNPAFNNVYRVIRWDDASGSVTSSPDGAIADPRFPKVKHKGDSFATGRHYGVVQWDESAGTITGSGQHDNGANSVADPRPLELLRPNDKPNPPPWIWSLDNTRHRPLTTLEGGALQGFDVLAPTFSLEGSDGDNRKDIGNAVPPPAAEGIANTMLGCLLANLAGERFRLTANRVWVLPDVALALSVPL